MQTYDPSIVGALLYVLAVTLFFIMLYTMVRDTSSSDKRFENCTAVTVVTIYSWLVIVVAAAHPNLLIPSRIFYFWNWLIAISPITILVILMLIDLVRIRVISFSQPLLYLQIFIPYFIFSCIFGFANDIPVLFLPIYSLIFIVFIGVHQIILKSRMDSSE